MTQDVRYWVRSKDIDPDWKSIKYGFVDMVNKCRLQVRLNNQRDSNTDGRVRHDVNYIVTKHCVFLLRLYTMTSRL